ncbi:MAG: hypothetical protein M9897_04780 [Brumimicrobium sp.]|nr:hypothetical protein [Brumimicrobium sp.]
MTQKIVGFIILILCSMHVFSQNEEDVLRYSTTDIFGSARFEAMAGSFGALGADISAIQINPASIGRFSRSTASASLNMSFLQNKAIFNETTTNSNYNKLALSTLGVVFTNDLSTKNNGRRYNQITLAYTRLKNFSNHRVYEGQEFYSLLDVLANDGAGIDPSLIYDYRPFTTGLAYDTYAVDWDDISGQYYSRLTNGDMYHHREITNGGGIGEYHIGYSENYANILYYGASLGIRRVKYNESYDHTERLLDTVGTSLRSFTYSYDQTTKGTGFNLKLGILYLPINEIRLGLAFETPSIIRFEDKWSTNMTAEHADGVKSILPEYVPIGKFSYRIKTPMKLRGSVAYIFGMRGAINIDVEMSHLPGGKLRSQAVSNNQTGPLYNFDIENQEVKNQFRTVFNTRIGIEYMIAHDLYLRAGFALLPQPYKKSIGNIKTPDLTYSGGLGWENKFVYIDVSYRLLQTHSDYYAFDPSKIENRTQFKTNVHHVVLTAGFKF